MIALRRPPGPLAVYQRIADKAACIRRHGYSDHAIAVEVAVSDKTAAKAIRWFEAGGRVGS